ncbi:SDR family NAD(P)-dependent oxidoreductase [Natrarchaeobius chitinivorans]|uniref:SDR family oxidoreductase n=1 Tax=Natrarchaeobius chitinivorans TaxID=1679083 RepID=A0A3N6N764_NATCH|nr:SDR family NAD(P)-dependent oxidoreductase [Natrarchaeobius chitinivorans]RQG94232.1 SDR family oxidoreductase [Natrarchaeobius chitinivorans]
MTRFENQVAVVTAGSTGIGRSIALALADEGADVVIGDIQEEPAGGERYGHESDRPTHREIEARGGNASFVGTDIGEPEQCNALIDHTLETFDRLDILVNNAGIHIEGGIESLDSEQWQDVIDVNLTGTFHCSKFATPHLKTHSGSIVNIASVHAIEGGSGPAYASSKAGMVNLTRDLATELGPHDVTVNAVCPGFIKTPRQDYLTDDEVDRSREQTVLPRLGEPDDVARAVTFLASPDASWITGETLFVDGGWTAHRGV